MLGSFTQMKKVLRRVLFLNFGVSIVKISLGVLTNSVSITADGFHSFSDGSSNIVGLIGLKLASKPKDAEHPYGHKKLENFTAIGIAMMLFLVCFELIKNSVDRLRHQVEPTISPLSFIVIGLTMIVNYFVMTYEFNQGKKYKSDILIADSHHTRSDIYVSLSVIASLIAVGLGFPLADPLVSIIIIICIGRVAFGILRSTSKVLCDAAIIDSNEIKKVVMKLKGIKGCHKIRTRGREDDIMVDLHIAVDKAMHVKDAHDITKDVEGVVRRSFGGISEVIVHIEPAGEKTH